MKKILFLIGVFASTAVFGQISEGRRITEKLCSSEMSGRGYVRSGDSLAAEFLASEFERRKLKPLRKQESYFQEFEFDVNTFPGAMQLKVQNRLLQPGVDYMVDPASGSSNTEWNYRYLDRESLFSQDTMELLLHELRNTRSWNSLVIDPRGLHGDTLKEVKSFARALTEACHVILLSEEKFVFSVASEQLRFSLIYLKPESYVSGAKVESHIQAQWKENHVSRNVMAYLPAKRWTRKTVFVTAHYDHLGMMGSETYFPGANDNASGTSMLFALADHFKKHRSRYNMVFIAFAGEEAGLLGSKYFVEHPPVRLKKIRFLLNLDIMGSGEEGVTVVNGSVYRDQFDRLVALNEKEQLLQKIKIRGKAANSDHYWFSEKGVPSFFIYTMGPNKHYHDVFDTYDELSFAAYENVVKLLVSFVEQL
ncbi:MAG: M20/M25/M40 family metallo-hydrolase [Bacteroidetes bacterium]|nr:MAG: M20/M25/M40 family metallo-hydrolase [Bacteroidota bacterium]